ncbi:M48 family metallopeptidase [Streptomyces sp. NPDC051554]|uniref:M48 family metallopeptidase n=1 Tax=Streptomyces sp. NPDC051554 TaxID=3365656 RepID=UPI00378D7F56
MSWVAGYTKAGLVALVVIAVLVVATTVVTFASLGRAVDRDRAAVAPRKIEAVVARCSERLGIDAPRVRVVDDEVLNAFVVGFGRNATVVFTSVLVELLEARKEDGDDLLEVVTAHELTGLAGHGGTLTHISYCLLGWALVVLDCVGVLVAFLWVCEKSFLEANPTTNRRSRLGRLS